MKFLRKGIVILLVLVAALSMVTTVAGAEGADPTGASYIATTGTETLDQVATVANKAYFGANYTWVMICAFMVFFFQCGFAMVETGFCRGKNAAHTMDTRFRINTW